MASALFEHVFRDIVPFRRGLVPYLSASELALLTAISNVELSEAEKSKYLNPIRDLGTYQDAVSELQKSGDCKCLLVGAGVYEIMDRIAHPLRYFKVCGMQRVVTVGLVCVNFQAKDESGANEKTKPATQDYSDPPWTGRALIGGETSYFLDEKGGFPLQTGETTWFAGAPNPEAYNVKVEVCRLNARDVAFRHIGLCLNLQVPLSMVSIPRQRAKQSRMAYFLLDGPPKATCMDADVEPGLLSDCSRMARDVHAFFVPVTEGCVIRAVASVPYDLTVNNKDTSYYLYCVNEHEAEVGVVKPSIEALKDESALVKTGDLFRHRIGDVVQKHIEAGYFFTGRCTCDGPRCSVVLR